MLQLSIPWGTDLELAKITAKNENKFILLNFSGSDWCGPCIILRKDYFENEAFLQMAKNNLVLLNADFPRKKKNAGTPEQIKNNENLAVKYNSKGLFPLTLLLDANGNVLHSWEGKPEKGVVEWVAEINNILLVTKNNNHD